MASNQKRNVQFNIASWSFKKYAEFLKLIDAAQFVKAWRLVEPDVVKWDYEVDPHDPEVGKKLTYEDLVAIVNAIRDTIDLFIKSVSKDKFQINLNNWDWNDWEDFQDAIQAGDEDRIIKYFVQAVEGEHNLSAENLSFVDGVSIREAIGERQKVLFRRG